MFEMTILNEHIVKSMNRLYLRSSKKRKSFLTFENLLS